MKNILIVENQTESLHINESASNSSKFLLSGKFTEFDVENRNKRFYTAQNFVPVMNQLLEKKKMLGVIYGEFDHPDVFDIAGKNASHAIENLTHNENGNCVDGTIGLLSTHWGKEARAIINDGYPLFVSSRAAGVTDNSGNVMLKELFTYDIVLDPGFASAQVSINESCGYQSTPDVHYRIYEMNDTSVNNLHIDNKNDGKTRMDLKEMERYLATEMVKIKHQIMAKMTENRFAPEEMTSLLEKYESLNEELGAVKLYLEEFKKTISHLVSQNNTLTEANKKLVSEINEQTIYSNHIASNLKKLSNYTNEIESRLAIDEKMIEYVAEHAKANILFTEDIANDITKLNESLANNTEFLEYVAEETQTAQQFAENIAKEADAEIKLTQNMLEYVATETQTAQQFGEYIAKEATQDSVFLEYVANKVDGMIGYIGEAVNKIQSATPINENATEDSIHSLENIEDYLGITQEREIVNNIEETTEVVESTEEVTNEDLSDENTEDTVVEPGMENTEDVTVDGDGFENTENAEDAVVTTEEPVVEPGMENTEDTVVTTEEPIVNAEDDTLNVQPEVETSMETTLLSALVKILGTDDTGIVMEVTPENKVIIQKSGTDETVELGDGEYEVMNVEENLTNTVNDVLAEIKKQQVLANQQPHFFSFMSEQQVIDFKNLDKDTQDAIMLAMNESEYYTAEDVLGIIGQTLNNKAMSYEEKLISNVPENLKEAWNVLSQDQKISVITESKYFSLVTTADIKNFWATRPFAKAVTGPEATLIKESLNIENKESLDDEYINAFLNTVDKYSIK